MTEYQIKELVKENERLRRLEARARADNQVLRKALHLCVYGDVQGREFPFRADLQPSRHDRCKHERYHYQDCVDCMREYLEKVLNK